MRIFDRTSPAADVALTEPRPGDGATTLRVTLCGIRFHALSSDAAAEYIFHELAHGRGGWLVNPNIDVLRQLSGCASLQALVNSADLVLADGVPVVWLSRVLGHPLPARVAGSDFVWAACQYAARRGLSVFFLGGAPGVGAQAASNAQKILPKLVIAGCYAPPFRSRYSEAELEEMVAVLRDSQPGIVLCALGFPKQELLIHRLLPYFPSAWFLSLGAAVDFMAGRVRRAPLWAQNLGLEWLFRVIAEPKRLFTRYLLKDAPFFLRSLLSITKTRITGVGLSLFHNEA